MAARTVKSTFDIPFEYHGTFFFRWPLHKQDLLLATEVTSRQAIKRSEFEPIASVLSVEFSKLTQGKPVSLTARACRERMERLLEKYIHEDKKALKRYIEE